MGTVSFAPRVDPKGRASPHTSGAAAEGAPVARLGAVQPRGLGVLGGGGVPGVARVRALVEVVAGLAQEVAPHVLQGLVTRESVSIHPAIHPCIN